MKLHKLFFSIVLMIMLASPTMAQDAASVTDEELKKYAVAMDSIEVMKNHLIKVITEMVEHNEKITATRYNELSRIIDDEVKLTEAKATAEEIAAIKAVVAKKEEETAKINETFQSLAKDYVGAGTYNKVRSALKSDSELKSKYDALMQELSKDNG
jgi:hypothetical protein